MSKTDFHDIEYRSGDTLHWAGRSLVSRGIALRTCSPRQFWDGQFISHSSIIAPYQGALKNWESTTLCPLPCDAQGEMVDGVQCHNPYKEIDAYDGKVWLGRLNRPLDNDQIRSLEESLTGQLGVPYDMTGAMLAGTRWLKQWFYPDASSLFCDELVLNEFMKLSIVPRTFDSQEKSPAWLAWMLVKFGYVPQLVRIK